MKLRILFHNPKGEHGIGKAIVGLTWVYGLFYGGWQALKYHFSHVEVWIADENGNFSEPYFIAGEGPRRTRYLGKCFSSTTRGDWNGVRFAPASEVLKHPERWSYIEIEVDDERFEEAIGFASLEVDKPYDFLAILGFVIPFGVQNKAKWYCSEICSWFISLCKGERWQFKRISPRRMAYNWVKAGYKLVPLKGGVK